MKKLFFASVLAFFAIASYAQNAQAKAAKKTPEQRAEYLTNWMAKKFTLSDEQRTKIYNVNLKYAKLNQETRTNDADNQKEMHQELKANEKEREAEFKTILTPEQFDSFQKAKQELAEKRIERKKRKR